MEQTRNMYKFGRVEGGSSSRKGLEERPKVGVSAKLGFDRHCQRKQVWKCGIMVARDVNRGNKRRQQR